MYEFERSVLSKDQLAQKTGKDMGSDVLGASGGRCCSKIKRVCPPLPSGLVEIVRACLASSLPAR